MSNFLVHREAIEADIFRPFMAAFMQFFKVGIIFIYMKLKLIMVMVILAMFIQEIRNFIELGGLSNKLALSLGKLTVYSMSIALIALDFATFGKIWTAIETALRIA